MYEIWITWSKILSILSLIAKDVLSLILMKVSQFLNHNVEYLWKKKKHIFFQIPIIWDSQITLPTAEILSGKNARAWVSMVLYLKKINEN